MSTIRQYLDYNPPEVIAALKHTTNKTTVPANPHTDDIEITEWTSFEDNAREFADQVCLEYGADSLLRPLPRKQQFLISSEASMTYPVQHQVSQPLLEISEKIFGQKVYSIADVRGLLSLDADAGIVCNPPDDISNRIARCAIEYKTIYAFPSVPDGSLVEAYTSERDNQLPRPAQPQTRSSKVPKSEFGTTSLNDSDTTKVSRAITQLWGYMTINHLRYGILTTLNDTYFFRRLDHSQNTQSKLEVSPCVSTGQGQVSFMTALLYFTSLVDEQFMYISPYVTPTKGRKVLSSANVYDAQELSLSDIKFTHTGPVQSTVAQADIGTSNNPLKVHVKLFDLSRDEEAMEKFNLEVLVYKQLESLQGLFIPKLYGCFLASNFLYGLFLELCGPRISDQDFNDKSTEISELIKKLHFNGVAHGDVAFRNVLVKDGQIRLIDFDHCHLRGAVSDEEWEDLIQQDFDRLKQT